MKKKIILLSMICVGILAKATQYGDVDWVWNTGEWVNKTSGNGYFHYTHRAGTITLVKGKSSISASNHVYAEKNVDSPHYYYYRYYATKIGNCSGNNDIVHLELNNYSAGSTYSEDYKITNIVAGAFKNCLLLEDVKLPSEIKCMPPNLFENCSRLTICQGGFTNVGQCAFLNCSSIDGAGIDFWSGVVTIGSSAFQNCTNLSEVGFCDNLCEIGNQSFEGCLKLNAVTLPAGVKKIGSRAFYGSGIKSITYQGDAPNVAADSFDGLSEECVLYVPRESTGWNVSIPGVWNGVKIRYIGTSENPQIMPESGTIFEGYLSVSISCPTEGATIYYTTDGSEPTESSPLYTEPFAINDTTTVKAKAFKEDWFESETTTATFTRKWYTVATPVIEPSSMSFANVSQSVSISCATEGATILYTTDGSDPAANGLEYRKPFSVYSSCTVRAVAVKDDWKNSQVATSTLSRSESLSEAANLYGYTMETDEVAPWTVVTDVSRDGVSSVRSGAIGNNGITWLQTSIKKAGTISFWWKAACEEADEEEGEDGYYDYGAFLVDDVVVARIAGHDGEWHYVSHEITSGGKHTLKWEYRKDGATSYAPDCVWVDQVQWIPADGSGYTLTTPEPVPYAWLDAYRLGVGTDYETAGNAASGKMQGGRLLQVWQDYVAGTDPTNLASRFTAKIEMVDGAPVVKWEPDLNTNGVIRAYKVYGKETLEGGGEWQYPTNSLHRFFKVTVEMP